MCFQAPVYFLLGSLAYLFPQQSCLLALSIVAWVMWQRHH